MRKKCSKCKLEKDESEFFLRKTKSGKSRLHSWCKECKREADRNYVRRNRQKVNNRAKEWYRENTERKKTYDRLYKTINAKRISLVRKLNYRARKKERIKKSREWYLENKEKRRKYLKDYRRRNPLIFKRRRIKRRLMLQAAAGSHTEAQRRLIKKHYAPDNICLSCGRVDNLTLDHVVPISIGGSNYPDNLQPICVSCNSIKRDKEIDFRSDKGQWIRETLMQK